MDYPEVCPYCEGYDLQWELMFAGTDGAIEEWLICNDCFEKVASRVPADISFSRFVSWIRGGELTEREAGIVKALEDISNKPRLRTVVPPPSPTASIQRLYVDYMQLREEIARRNSPTPKWRKR